MKVIGNIASKSVYSNMAERRRRARSRMGTQKGKVGLDNEGGGKYYFYFYCAVQFSKGVLNCCRFVLFLSSTDLQRTFTYARIPNDFDRGKEQ